MAFNINEFITINSVSVEIIFRIFRTPLFADFMVDLIGARLVSRLQIAIRINLDKPETERKYFVAACNKIEAIWKQLWIN